MVAEHREIKGIDKSGYSPSRPRQVDYQPLGCGICKRRESDGHHPTCEHYTGPVRVQGPSLAEWAEAEKRRRAEATPVPAGRVTPSAAPGPSKGDNRSGPVSTLIINPEALEAVVANPDGGACWDCGAEIRSDRLRCLSCTRANGNPKRPAVERAPKPPPGPVACAHCGAEFVPSNGRRYCPACTANVRRRKPEPEPHPCGYCGAMVNAKRAHCDPACARAAKRQAAAEKAQAIGDQVETKACIACEVPKPIGAFWLLRNGARQAKCGDCIRAAIAAGHARAQTFTPPAARTPSCCVS